MKRFITVLMVVFFLSSPVYPQENCENYINYSAVFLGLWKYAYDIKDFLADNTYLLHEYNSDLKDLLSDIQALLASDLSSINDRNCKFVFNLNDENTQGSLEMLFHECHYKIVKDDEEITLELNGSINVQFQDLDKNFVPNSISLEINDFSLQINDVSTKDEGENEGFLIGSLKLSLKEANAGDLVPVDKEFNLTSNYNKSIQGSLYLKNFYDIKKKSQLDALNVNFVLNYLDNNNGSNADLITLQISKGSMIQTRNLCLIFQDDFKVDFDTTLDVDNPHFSFIPTLLGNHDFSINASPLYISYSQTCSDDLKASLEAKIEGYLISDASKHLEIQLAPGSYVQWTDIFGMQRKYEVPDQPLYLGVEGLEEDGNILTEDDIYHASVYFDGPLAYSLLNDKWQLNIDFKNVQYIFNDLTSPSDDSYQFDVNGTLDFIDNKSMNLSGNIQNLTLFSASDDSFVPYEGKLQLTIGDNKATLEFSRNEDDLFAKITDLSNNETCFEDKAEKLLSYLPVPLYLLKVKNLNADRGQIVTEPYTEYFVCGSRCSMLRQAGDEFVLKAIAEPGYLFTGWGGDCAKCGSNPECAIVMDADKICTAAFEPSENPPLSPQLLSPADGASDVSYSEVDLAWQYPETSDSSLRYNFYFGQMVDGQCVPTLKVINLESPTYQEKDLQPGASYCWKVEACNRFTCTAGPVWHFSTRDQELLAITNFTADVTSGTAPLTVNFTCNATGQIASYKWDFDDDGQTDLQTATGELSYTYQKAGTYQAQCTVVDDQGAQATARLTIEVKASEENTGAEESAPAASEGSSGGGGGCALQPDAPFSVDICLLLAGPMLYFLAGRSRRRRGS